jgi:signal transduction histidine kinase
MPRIGLRLRVAAVFAAACMTVVGTLGVTLYIASERLEEALLEQIVSEELDDLVRRHRDQPELPQPVGPNLQYFAVRADEEAAKLPPHLRGLAAGQHEVGSGRDELHVGVRRAGDMVFVVAYDAGPHEAREQEFSQLVLASLAVVAVIALVLGYWLAGVLTRQITELARRLPSLAPGPAHPLLARSDQDTEVRALAQALDEYLGRIARMIQREQEFTANASHELRTPLTAIRTSCELLLADRALPEKARTRLEMMNTAAGRMEEQIQTLLFLAREMSIGAVEPVSIRDCVEDAVGPFRPAMGQKGLSFEARLEPGAVLSLNRQALQTVLSNLIRNAVQYTERGFIRITYGARRLTVADSGSGIAAEDQPKLFERFYRAAPERGGFGIGLAIVKQICDACGWTIEVASAPGRGSVFEITFP